MPFQNSPSSPPSVTVTFAMLAKSATFALPTETATFRYALLPDRFAQPVVGLR